MNLEELLTFLWMTVGVFLIVALRTRSMKSAEVGTGAMRRRPATDDMTEKGQPKDEEEEEIEYARSALREVAA